jgi:hypothetical protein
MAEYFTKMKTHADEMVAYGQPLGDEEFVTYVLTGLDDEFYIPLVSSIVTHIEPISPSELYSQMLSYEQCVDKHPEGTTPVHLLMLFQGIMEIPGLMADPTILVAGVATVVVPDMAPCPGQTVVATPTPTIVVILLPPLIAIAVRTAPVKSASCPVTPLASTGIALMRSLSPTIA